MAGTSGEKAPPQRSKSGFSVVDAIQWLLLAVGVAFLCFVLGSWVTWRDIPPYRDHLRNAFLGVQAIVRAKEPTENPLANGLWGRPRRKDGRRGVIEARPERAAPGLTLMLVGESAHLIDLQGTIRHTWHIDFDKIITPEERRSGWPHESRAYWRPARVFPNGDLMVMVDIRGITPQGVALVRLDRDSRPRWIFHGKVHHDFDIAEDGRVLVLGQALRQEAPKGLKLRGPLIDERIFVLSPEGTLLRDISLVDAFAGTPYARLVNALKSNIRYDKGDYLHSNNLEIADAATAARFPFVREGQLLLSMRELSALATIDMETGKIVWARRGSWMQQHDPDFLENGHLLIYDNQGDIDRGGLTRIIEWDPATEAITWQYSGPKGRELWSRVRGEQQRLANGNTLINEFEGGRLLEVTGDGELAWEYLCPFQLPKHEKLVCNIMYAERYAPEEVSFALNEGRVPAP